MENFKQNIDLVPLEDVKSFLEDLKLYDKQHGRGAWLGRGMASFFLGGFEEEKKEGGGLDNLKKEIDNNITPQDMYNMHSETLQKLGIDIESPNKEGDVDEKEKFAVGEIGINLVNKDLYLNYLKTLNKENLQPEHKEILEMIVDKIRKQVQNEYSLDTVDDRLFELLAGIKNIVLEYERIGLSDEVKNLKDYQQYLGSGYLKEYILARNHNVFEPIGEGFNLSTYQRDSSYENYKNMYWKDNFFDVLDKVKQNPDADEFYNKVVEYGKSCLEFAEKDLDDLDEKYGTDEGGKKYMENVRRAVEETKEKVNKL